MKKKKKCSNKVTPERILKQGDVVMIRNETLSGEEIEEGKAVLVEVVRRDWMVCGELVDRWLVEFLDGPLYTDHRTRYVRNIGKKDVILKGEGR